MKYDVYSDFDLQKHKETYINYLEVILFPDGHIEYAVPSHQEKLIRICCEKLNVSRETLFEMCPPDYFFDVCTWLCTISGCVSLWTDHYIASDENPLTQEQMDTINLLRSEDLLRC